MSLYKGLLLSFLAARVVFGQLTGDLQVNVTDATNAAIPNAAVTVKNLDTGAQRTATTDVTGATRVNQLGVGRYEVRAGHDGFASAAVEASIVGGTSTTLALTLSVAASSQQVEVIEPSTP